MRLRCGRLYRLPFTSSKAHSNVSSARMAASMAESTDAQIEEARIARTPTCLVVRTEATAKKCIPVVFCNHPCVQMHVRPQAFWDVPEYLRDLYSFALVMSCRLQAWDGDHAAGVRVLRILGLTLQERRFHDGSYNPWGPFFSTPRIYGKPRA